MEQEEPTQEELTKTEQKLKELIQQAWCEGDNNPKDKFGDFLNRAAKAIKEDWDTKEKEYLEAIEDARLSGFESGKAMMPKLAKEAGYVKLADDQSLPRNDYYYEGKREIYSGAQQDMLKAGWRKIEVKE